jgi:hypothetical protein
MSALFISLYQFDKNAQISLAREETMAQEKIQIDEIEIESDPAIVSRIRVNNTGSTTARISAVYIDGDLKFEPLVDINAKEILWISMLPNTMFEPSSRITVTTGKGIKSVVNEGQFIASQLPSGQGQKTYFGPLELDYDQFKYGIYEAGVLKSPGWINGWSISSSNKNPIGWQITVTNIDSRDIVLNKFSCLSLVPNVEGGQSPWYIEKIEHTPASNSFKIKSQETVTITYRWSDPTDYPNTGAIQNTPKAGLYRVLLTFFGNYNQFDGTIIPYGQTIPFEAVVVTT